MVDNCPGLQELRMSQFGLICDEWLPSLAKLKNLISFDVGSPGQFSLHDDAVIALLQEIGPALETLNLSKHTALTDRVLLEGIAKYCPRIQHLVLHNMPDYAFKRQEDEQPDSDPKGITNEGMAKFFKAWKANGHKGLVSADLHGNYMCGTQALKALIEHSGATLEYLNISGWGQVSHAVLGSLGAECKNLRTLDLGWCRDLTDLGMRDILNGCDGLKVVTVWGKFTISIPCTESDDLPFSGCNKLTDAVPRKKGCKVTGIETHTI
jgi:DNA repair protein RAD7